MLQHCNRDLKLTLSAGCFGRYVLNAFPNRKKQHYSTAKGKVCKFFYGIISRFQTISADSKVSTDKQPPFLIPFAINFQVDGDEGRQLPESHQQNTAAPDMQPPTLIPFSINFQKDEDDVRQLWELEPHQQDRPVDAVVSSEPPLLTPVNLQADASVETDQQPDRVTVEQGTQCDIFSISGDSSEKIDRLDAEVKMLKKKVRDLQKKYDAEKAEVQSLQTHMSDNIMSSFFQGKCFERYEIQTNEVPEKNLKLGAGSFGTVYLSHFSDQPCAVKEFHQDLHVSQTDVTHEARCLLAAESTGVVPYLVALSTTIPFHLITTFHGIGKESTTIQALVNQVLCNNDMYSFSGAASWESVFLSVAEGMQKLARIGLVHGDLKQDNIIVTDEDGKHIRFIDLGKAQPLRRCRPRKYSRAGRYPWIDPEVLDGSQPMSCLSDIYSLGFVISWVMRKLNFSSPRLLSVASVCKEKSVSRPNAKFICRMLK